MKVISSLKYRPEIDGLRAIAVLSVIIYHLNSNWLPGGYLGVDVFFVISGYLITSIIFTSITSNSFSIQKFWIRRIKRLFPALISMVTVVFCVSSVILIRPERNDIPIQTIATIFSFNNVILWKTSGGYWSASSDNIPLLHTWSLSVEEQFYLCFPLILYFLVKFAKKTFAIYLFFAFSISLGLFAYGNQYHPNATFFLLPTRMWELLMGSILALLPSSNFYLTKKNNSNFLALVGIIFLLTSLCKIIPISSSFYNLLACIGAFLIIQNTSTKGLVRNFLKSRYIVSVGKISYSLYLWHWPIIVFSKYLDTERNYILISSIIIFCSILSYFFIEKPVRYSSIKTKYILAPLPIISLSCIFLYTVNPTSLLIGSLGNIDTDEALTRGWKFEATKLIERGEAGLVFNDETRIQNKPIVVLGSSHARVLCKPLKSIADNLNLPFISMCTSGIGIMSDTPTETRPNAALINDKRFKKIAEIKPALLLIGGMWSSEINTNNFENRLKDKLQYLSKHSKRVVIVGQVPMIELPDGYKNAMRKYIIAINNSDNYRYLKSSIDVQKANKAIETIVKNLNYNNITFINPYSLFIDEKGQVIFLKDGKFLYSDFHHVNDTGASLIVDNLLYHQLDHYSLKVN